MATITKPHTFTAGEIIVASEHNSNFDTIYDDYNGNITNVNIDASAAVVESKLLFSATGHGHTGTTDGNLIDFSALDIASEARGDIMYRNATAWTRLAAGTSGEFLKTLGSGADPAWAAVASGLPAPDFTSSEQTVTASTELTVAHSLAVVPNLYTVVLRCKTADGGWGVDDELVVTTYGLEGSSGGRGVSMAANATNVVLQTGGVLVFNGRTAGGEDAITLASWKWVIRAWK